MERTWRGYTGEQIEQALRACAGMGDPDCASCPMRDRGMEGCIDDLLMAACLMVAAARKKEGGLDDGGSTRRD